MQTAPACARRRPSTALALTLALVLAATAVAAGAGPSGAAAPTAAAGGRVATGTVAEPGFGEPGIPVRPASERYVREAYAAALGRSADEPGLAYWGGRLDDGLSRSVFAVHLTRSAESLRRHLQAAYETFGRPPTSTELDADHALVRTRRSTVEGVLVRLLASEEFYEGEGGDSPAGFVQALYNSVLERAPDQAGADYWVARLQAGASRTTVARGFVYAGPRVDQMVVGAYDRVLLRAPDPGGRAHWGAALKRGTSIVDVLAGLVASTEAETAGCTLADTGHCMLPFPSDEMTIADPTTDTGRRVLLKSSWLPETAAGAEFDPTEWNRQDGFSPGSALLVHSAGIDPERSGLPPLSDIGASLDEGSQVVVVDTTDGTRWPVWVELDSHAPNDAERALVIRPARNFLDGHTYAVGIGEVVDAAGEPVGPSPGFRVFRDDLPSTSRRVNEERVRVEHAIEQVVSAGLDRESLHVAWTFTVASTRNLAERIVHMRDEALGGFGGVTAPEFTVTRAEHRDDDGTTRVEGTFEVPLYLTGDGAPGSRLNLGDDDLPEQNGTMTAPFVCTVPDSARATPARAALYGHGLLGRGSQANSGYVRAVSREHNMVFCGTDYLGMSEGDVPNTVGIIGDLSRFSELADRNQQGLLNFILLGRLMTLPDGLVTHEAFQGQQGAAAIDRSDLTYYGLSQGGIMGGALVAVSPDLTRGVLGVPGMNYSTLLERSVDFDPFFLVMAGSYPSALDRILLISVIQMLWDRGEGNGYANHMTTDPLPGTPTAEVLLQVAFGDHQVAIAAADVQARTYGAATNEPPLEEGRSGDVEPLWGIERIESWPHEGSATIYWDSGTPAPPYENVPPRPPEHGEDPHSDPRNDPDARVQISEFLQPDGVVVDVCDGGPCLVDFE